MKNVAFIAIEKLSDKQVIFSWKLILSHKTQ